MSKLYVQKMPAVLEVAGSMAANASTSGSVGCDGYARLVGGLFSSCSLESPSGLSVEYSFDGGGSWDHVSASDTLGAGAVATCSQEVLGNAVRVTVRMGSGAASRVSGTFMLRPV